MSQEIPPVPPLSKIERPNGHRPAAAPKKSLQLSPTTTVIILIVIAAVIFFLPTQKSTVKETAAPAVVEAQTLTESAPIAPAPQKLLTPAQEDLQYQSLVQQVASMQQDVASLTQKLQTLQEMMLLLQENEHAKALIDSESAKE